MFEKEVFLRVKVTLLHKPSGREVQVSLSQGDIAPLSGFGGDLLWEDHLGEIAGALKGANGHAFEVCRSFAIA